MSRDGRSSNAQGMPTFLIRLVTDEHLFFPTARRRFLILHIQDDDMRNNDLSIFGGTDDDQDNLILA
jgi:hypothetical protein